MKLALRYGMLIAAPTAAFLVLAVTTPASAMDGGGPAPSMARNCTGFVRAASMSLDKAQKQLDALQNRTATRAEHDKARKKVDRARAKLRKAEQDC